MGECGRESQDTLWQGFIPITGGGFPIAGLPLEYSPSRIYIYKYNTEVAFNEPEVQKTTQAKKDVGFKLSSDVLLTPVWNRNNKMLVKLQVKS